VRCVKSCREDLVRVVSDTVDSGELLEYGQYYADQVDRILYAVDYPKRSPLNWA
jgi:hypothetical protein